MKRKFIIFTWNICSKFPCLNIIVLNIVNPYLNCVSACMFLNMKMVKSIFNPVHFVSMFYSFNLLNNSAGIQNRLSQNFFCQFIMRGLCTYVYYARVCMRNFKSQIQVGCTSELVKNFFWLIFCLQVMDLPILRNEQKNLLMIFFSMTTFSLLNLFQVFLKKSLKFLRFFFSLFLMWKTCRWLQKEIND